MNDAHSITIAVITCRRTASLAQTLRSLAALTIPEGVHVKLLVVDNDADASARAVCDAAKGALPFPLDYAVEEKRGIPHARNRALAEGASSDYLAFLDDDDTADTSWLSSLYRAAREYGADVVKGQVVYHFPPEKSYLSRLDIFAPVAAKTGQELDSAWTNNVLFATKIYRSGLRFDAAFTGTGGSDHHFFRIAKAAGAKIVMCQEAIVHTQLPPERMRWNWLARRNLRVGATLTLSDVKAKGHRYALAQLSQVLPDSLQYCVRLMPAVKEDKRLLVLPAMVTCFMLGRVMGLFHLSPREYT